MSVDDPGPAFDVAGFDLDRSTAEAWTAFAERLAEVVSVMDAGATLTIGALAAGDTDRPPHVRFACGEHGRLTLESGDTTLDGTQEDSRELADAAVAALRDVHGVPHPAFLAPDQLSDILTPAPVRELPPPDAVDPEEATAVLPTSRDNLEALLEAHLTRQLGHPPFRDLDGDFGLRVGSTMVFVRASQDAREVLVFSALVHDVEGRQRAMEVLSDLNTDARFVRFLLIRDRVFVSLSIFAAPFVPAHLRQALRAVSVIGDSIDNELAAKLRGRTTFADDGDAGGDAP